MPSPVWQTGISRECPALPGGDAVPPVLHLCPLTCVDQSARREALTRPALLPSPAHGEPHVPSKGEELGRRGERETVSEGQGMNTRAGLRPKGNSLKD